MMVNVIQLDDYGLVEDKYFPETDYKRIFGFIGTLSLVSSSIEEMAFSTNAGIYSLYKGQLKRHLTNVSLSNGLTWNDSLNKFYHVDSWAGTISEFDFENETICILFPILNQQVYKLKKNYS